MYCNIYVLVDTNRNFSQLVIFFRQDCVTCKSGATHVKRLHTQLTCVTCSVPVKTGSYTYFSATSSSRRIHAIAFNKARKLPVTSLARCKLTYLQFAGEFTRVVIADCLPLQVFLPAFAGIFTSDCGYSCLQEQAILDARRVKFCMSSASKIAGKISILFR